MLVLILQLFVLKCEQKLKVKVLVSWAKCKGMVFGIVDASLSSVGEGVNIDCIYYTIKSSLFLFLLIPSPHEDNML